MAWIQDGYIKKGCRGIKVVTIWEATIGNMGRVIYIFEVQTKNIDSLIINAQGTQQSGCARSDGSDTTQR